MQTMDGFKYGDFVFINKDKKAVKLLSLHDLVIPKDTFKNLTNPYNDPCKVPQGGAIDVMSVLNTIYKNTEEEMFDGFSKLANQHYDVETDAQMSAEGNESGATQYQEDFDPSYTLPLVKDSKNLSLRSDGLQEGTVFGSHREPFGGSVHEEAAQDEPLYGGAVQNGTYPHQHFKSSFKQASCPKASADRLLKSIFF